MGPGGSKAEVGRFHAYARNRLPSCLNHGRTTTDCLGLINAPEQAKWTVFSFVRIDATSRALSAAAQIRKRPEEVFSAAASAIETSPAPSDAAKRVSMVTGLLGAGTGCHGCIQEHLAPQLWELSVPARWKGAAAGALLHYDFIGHVENFANDFDHLMRLLRIKHGWHAAYDFRNYTRANARSAAANQTGTPASVTKAIRLLYKDDINCFT